MTKNMYRYTNKLIPASVDSVFSYADENWSKTRFVVDVNRV